MLLFLLSRIRERQLPYRHSSSTRPNVFTRNAKDSLMTRRELSHSGKVSSTAIVHRITAVIVESLYFSNRNIVAEPEREVIELSVSIPLDERTHPGLVNSCLRTIRIIPSAGRGNDTRFYLLADTMADLARTKPARRASASKRMYYTHTRVAR